MTKNKEIIITMIQQEFTNSKIISYTGCKPSYINKIRRGLVKQKKLELMRRIKEMELANNPNGPKPKRDYSGYNTCLAEDCEEKFYTDDKRYNHFCFLHDQRRFDAYALEVPDHKFFSGRKGAG